MQKRKLLKIGPSDFKKLIEGNGYFVDKTLFIKEVIDNGHEVIVIPRPRRFGKSLNLSMLQYYFDITKKESTKLFETFKIWNETDFYTQQQGKYPVIYLSLKAAKASNFEDSITFFKQILKNLFEEHRYLLVSKTLSPQEQIEFEQILAGTATTATCLFSLRNLSKYLYHFYGEKKRVLILLDEYDAPIHTGFEHGFYDKIIEMMRSFMGNTFKDNSYLYKGVITGILRISSESIFSDLNNPGIFSILNYDFADKFGFTVSETKTLLSYFQLEKDFEKVKEWYDGYKIGEVENLYNPWSITNYIVKHREGFKPYWGNTSSDHLIKSRIIEKEAFGVRKTIEQLIKGQSVSKYIDENIIFSDFHEDKELLWSLLVFCGYLSPVQKNDLNEYQISIPNYEIKTLFKKFVLEWFKKELKITQTTLKAMVNSLKKNQIKTFEKHFKKVMQDTFSYFDVNTEPERVYQAYVLGLLGIMGDDYIIKSNRESGEGRYDILLLPRKNYEYGIIIEIKQLDKDASKKRIDVEIADALKQIQKNKYHKELIAHKINNRIEMAMVFVGKMVYLEVSK